MQSERQLHSIHELWYWPVVWDILSMKSHLLKETVAYAEYKQDEPRYHQSMHESDAMTLVHVEVERNTSNVMGNRTLYLHLFTHFIT